MVFHTFTYTFEEQCGPSQYDDELGEEYFDTDEFEWEYDVSEARIAEALIKIYGKKGQTLQENCKTLLKEICKEEDLARIFTDLGVSSIDEAVAKAEENIKSFNHNGMTKVVNEYTMLDELLGDISYFLDNEDVNEAVQDAFRDEAYEDFRENY